MKEKKTPYSKIKLEGNRLIFRPYTLSDYKRCVDSNALRVKSKNKYDTPITIGTDDLKKFKERIIKYRIRGKDKIHYVFGLFEKDSGLHVGHIDILTINQEIKWGNLGYHIQNHSHNKGYATEGCKLALKAAFEHLNFHRIEASMEISNKASRKVAKKLNFDFEGKRRKFFPTDGGVDMWVYGINAIDYSVMKYFL